MAHILFEDEDLSPPQYCPFLNDQRNVCRASFSGMTVDFTKRSQFCCCEDYDRCPLFLAWLMRNRNFPTNEKVHTNG